MSSGPHQTTRPVTSVAPLVTLDVRFTPAPGRKLDDRFGPSARITVSASPPSLLIDGGGEGTELIRELVLRDGGAGVLHVTAQAASCDDGGADNPACYLARQDWGVPVRVAADGERRLQLMLLPLGVPTRAVGRTLDELVDRTHRWLPDLGTHTT